MGTTDTNEMYSRNQCILTIRVDGKEMEIPCNFGMTADEIKAVYPYIANMANAKIQNPALRFTAQSNDGMFADMSEDEYANLVEHIHQQSLYWYNKPEASLLEVAIRVALDIQLKGIDSVQDAFAIVTPFEHIHTTSLVSKEEADKILKDAGIETPVDTEFDPGDEQDIAIGIAGDVPVNIYDTDSDIQYLSDELDEMESNLATKDRFSEIAEGDINSSDLSDRYKSNYSPGKFDESKIGENGLLDMYSDSSSRDEIFGDDPDDGMTSAEIFGLDNAEEGSDDESENESEKKESDVSVSDNEEYVDEPEFSDIDED